VIKEAKAFLMRYKKLRQAHDPKIVFAGKTKLVRVVAEAYDMVEELTPHATRSCWYDELVKWLKFAYPEVYDDYKDRIMAVHAQGVKKRKA
jgi:hypothetical protein